MRQFSSASALLQMALLQVTVEVAEAKTHRRKCVSVFGTQTVVMNRGGLVPESRGHLLLVTQADAAGPRRRPARRSPRCRARAGRSARRGRRPDSTGDLEPMGPIMSSALGVWRTAATRPPVAGGDIFGAAQRNSSSNACRKVDFVSTAPRGRRRECEESAIEVAGQSATRSAEGNVCLERGFICCTITVSGRF